MPGLISRLRRWASPGAARNDAEPDRARPAARGLTDAIERAVAEGRLDEADRLAQRAAPHAAASVRLTECLARLRTAQGDPETAIRLIESCRARPRPASLRLLRAACLLQSGERREAHLDLHRWSGHASAPLDARILLALLEWRSGNHADAVATLQRNLRHLDEPRTLAALLLLSVHRGSSAQAATWASRLSRCAGSTGEATPFDAEVLLGSLGLPGPRRDAEPQAADADRLALELAMHEDAIAPLVEAQEERPHPWTIRLLTQALERIRPDLMDRAAAAEALARLHLLLGETRAARRWAAMGLVENPMSAVLSRIAEAPSGEAEERGETAAREKAA